MSNYLYGSSNLPPISEGVSIKCYFQEFCPILKANKDTGQLPRHNHIYIPPRGSSKPDILIIGEAPGSEEDEMNMPFFGRSGQLLRSVLEEVIGPNYLDHVAFTNSTRCFPP